MSKLKLTPNVVKSILRSKATEAQLIAAIDSAAAAPAPQPAATSEEPRKRGTYRRRDMAAEPQPETSRQMTAENPE